jgi:hypothetical protein
VRAAEPTVTRSRRYVVLGVSAVAVGLLAAAVLQPVAVLLSAAGLLIIVAGLSELRSRRRTWHSYELVADPDGVTTVFQTSTPFVPGTLIVFVDGIAHATVVEHPASGSFGLGWAPEKGSSLEASWREG